MSLLPQDWERFPKYKKKALKEKIDKLDYIKNVGLSKVAMKRMKK